MRSDPNEASRGRITEWRPAMFRSLKSFASLATMAALLAGAGAIMALAKYNWVEPLRDADPNWHTAKQKGPSLDEVIRALGDLPERVYEH